MHWWYWPRVYINIGSSNFDMWLVGKLFVADRTHLPAMRIIHQVLGGGGGVISKYIPTFADTAAGRENNIFAAARSLAVANISSSSARRERFRRLYSGGCPSLGTYLLIHEINSPVRARYPTYLPYQYKAKSALGPANHQPH